jgi:hypothetical protein
VNYARIELCRDLYGLSGWDADGYVWYGTPTGNYEVGSENEIHMLKERPDATEFIFFDVPAYDLGFLLRMLPTQMPEGDYLALQPWVDDEWCIGYFAYGEPSLYSNSADTPEDAACKLAIELFKRGILSRD